MNKNINNVVELTEKELACVCGGNDYPTPFGNKAWVQVRKGGAASVIKDKYNKLDIILKH